MTGGNRYSTMVAWAKVALPMIALALLSTLFLFSRTPDPEAALPFSDVDIDQLIREQRLSRPRFAGTLDDGREITLVADTASATVRDPNIIVMNKIESRVALSQDAALTLSADLGDLDLGTQVVTLTGSVIALSTDGYRMITERLTVAMDTMRLASPEAIVLTGPGVTLEAGAMDMTGADGDAFLSFTGGVRMLYEPEN
jgi:lipopolysaccharide export system protein LptC